MPMPPKTAGKGVAHCQGSANRGEKEEKREIYSSGSLLAC